MTGPAGEMLAGLLDEHHATFDSNEKAPIKPSVCFCLVGEVIVVFTMPNILGQPSWAIATPQVRAFVTQTGGHLGPVQFKLGRRIIEPFSVAPWAKEKLDAKTPPILKVLRGDFFCMPFGGNETPFGKERHPVHGEPANSKWELESLEKEREVTTLHLSLQTKVRRGRVDKRIRLVDGHTALYSQHIISRMNGPMTFGHHAMLRFPDEPGSGAISTSKLLLGRVFPGEFEKPENYGYTSLKPGAEFDSLSQVPTSNGSTTDLTSYPRSPRL